MTGTNEKLVRMAEQIVANCTIGDDQTSGAGKAAGHINRFWDPRMRGDLLRYTANSEVILSPVMRLVLEQINPPVDG